MAIENKDLTGGEVCGSGLYDELQRTTKAHLAEEYDAGRIHGTDYANVYLGSLQSNLSVAASFLLQRDLNNQQILLMQEQIRQAEKQNLLLDLQREQLRIANETAQYQLDNILPAQYAQLLAQTSSIVQQEAQSLAQTNLIETQDAGQLIQNGNFTKQGELIDAQKASELTNTTTPTAGLALTAYNKGLQEIEVLTAKKATEDAQVNDVATGVLGAQISLYKKQTDGFDRDAEQKAAKIFSDAFSVAHSITPETYVPADYFMDGPQSRKILDKLADGINVNFPDPGPDPTP